MDLGGRSARGVYEVEVLDVGRVRKLVGFVTVADANVFSLGEGPTNPGGRKVVIHDRRTSTVVAELAEDWGDEDVQWLPRLRTDLDTMSAAAFAETWLPDPSPHP